jgi:FtsP/CotA-like multicopper oxidase with cupredoxin domain
MYIGMSQKYYVMAYLNQYTDKQVLVQLPDTINGQSNGDFLTWLDGKWVITNGLQNDLYTIIYPFSGGPGQSPSDGQSQTEQFTSLNINQKRIYLGNTQSSQSFSEYKPNNSDANNGGIALKGSSDHYFIYDLETNSWLSSENINVNCDKGLYVCDQKLVDKYNLILGTNCLTGKIEFGGDGGFNKWRLEQDENGNLVAKYKRNDGFLYKKIIVQAPQDSPPILSGVDMYTEKRGLPYENKYYNIDKYLNNIEMNLSLTLRYNNMYYKSFIQYGDPLNKLSVDLNLSSEECIVAGRYMRNGCGYNGFYGGPLLIVRPGDTLTINMNNSDHVFADLPPWNDAISQYYKMGHQHIVPYDATYSNHTSYCIWMGHPMLGPSLNNHFHGVKNSPSGINDNILRTAKPNSSLLYEYNIPNDHAGGLYWYHPHVHGTSMTSLGRGSAGLIFIQGPYQNYLDKLGIRRQFLQFQRLNYKDTSDQSSITWYDYSAQLPTDLYNVDSSNNTINPTTFKPISYYPYCKYSNDYGPPGLCGCSSSSLSKTTLNGLSDGSQVPIDYQNPPSINIYWEPLLNAQVQPVFDISPNELQIFSFINTTTITFSRIHIEQHYIVVVGKDGVPSDIQSFINSNVIDPDSTHTPPGIYLNYLIVGPAERYEFFIIPMNGISTSGKIFNMNLVPIDQNEFFANDKNNTYFTTSGGSLVGNVLLATLKYNTHYIDHEATNSISQFLLNINTNKYTMNSPNVNYSNPNPNIKMDKRIDYHTIGYLQDRHIKDISGLTQTFNIVDISFITNYRNYTPQESFSINDPTYSVVQITLDPTSMKHFFSIYDGRIDPEGVYLNVNQTIIINNQSYKVFAIPVEIVYDSNGNDISDWVFYILDYDKSIYNTLIKLSPLPTLSFQYYTKETHNIPIIFIESTNNSSIITTKYNHRLTEGDYVYFDNSNNSMTVHILDYNKFSVLNNINSTITSVNFDTYNIKSEYLYLYSKEVYTNNNTYLTTKFFNNNGATFNMNNIDTYTSLDQKINNIFVYDTQKNTSFLYSKICSRRNIYYSFSQTVGNSGEGSTQVDGMKYNDDVKDTMLVNTKEEWLVENHTDVNHYHHQHVNSYQVCGYIDEAFGFNITNKRNGSIVDENNNYVPGDYLYDIQYDSTYNYVTNTPYNPTISNPQYPEQTYRYQNEIYVPYYGYEDTTSVPIGKGNNTVTSTNQTGVVEAPYGLRGRIRIRFTNDLFTGQYVHHCHLLDDQDMGMMKPIEIVGIDVSGNYYYPAPNINRIDPKGIKCDYYNNIWSIQPN